jgi:pSer/pThr/pTyr-binding forkhead associated (FHA) protein
VTGKPGRTTPLQSAVELKAVIEAERVGLPFLVYRDGVGEQQLLTLDGDPARITVGRAPACEVRIETDSEISRLHAELERLGDGWTVADDGLSRNGTYVNGERIAGRRLLREGDVIRFGRTTATFRQPLTAGVTETRVAVDAVDRASLSDAQRRVLVALCRPFKESSGYATPATNQQIAQELFLSVDAIKTHLRALFAKFGIEDLPQNQKRVRLVELALTSGIVTMREL